MIVEIAQFLARNICVIVQSSTVSCVNIKTKGDRSNRIRGCIQNMCTVKNIHLSVPTSSQPLVTAQFVTIQFVAVMIM